MDNMMLAHVCGPPTWRHVIWSRDPPNLSFLRSVETNLDEQNTIKTAVHPLLVMRLRVEVGPFALIQSPVTASVLLESCASSVGVYQTQCT